jgi:NAD+ diphosphatase
MTAWHLYDWYENHRFCGKCGAYTRHHENLRAMQCSQCGNLIFPVIAPAVIVAVTHGDRILLTRYAGRAYKGRALIAGFCEIGEEAEGTVRREVMEEAGLKVKNIRYFGSQPWGYASNLLLGYFAELEGSDEIHFDAEELQTAFWAKREELEPPLEGQMSLTETMIEHFRQGRE